ncbi:hypothetical protein ACFYW1_01575 [Streptomyces sp. NPDC002669]|uniref:hypothetical protein n=1 Tax=Streptomyces sp. NPDC002669 TaxID=3364658 RepID=UPI0036C9222F
MPTVETLIPQAGQADAEGLRAFDADLLAEYVTDPAHPWWRRRPCVLALAGRVPEHRVAGLIARVHDPRDVAEVRIALLDLLADRTELLPWLGHPDRRQEDSYGMSEAILKARGLLGDRSATGELTTLAASPWSRTRALGEAGLDALVARYGAGAVLSDVGDERPEDRAFRVRMRHRAGADVVDALADPDRAVAYLAQSLLTDPDRLRGHLDEAPTTEAKLWTAYALHRLTGDTAETRAIHASLGRPRVEVTGLDEELRSAIVQEYGRYCQERSDPRWRIEAICAGPPVPPDEENGSAAPRPRSPRRAWHRGPRSPAGSTTGRAAAPITSSASAGAGRRTTGTGARSSSAPWAGSSPPTNRSPPPVPRWRRRTSAGSRRKPGRSGSPTCASTTSATASPWTSPPCSSTGRTDAPARPGPRRAGLRRTVAQAAVQCGSRPLWASARSKTDADPGTATSSAKPSYCR